MVTMLLDTITFESRKKKDKALDRRKTYTPHMTNEMVFSYKSALAMWARMV